MYQGLSLTMLLALVGGGTAAGYVIVWAYGKRGAVSSLLAEYRQQRR